MVKPLKNKKNGGVTSRNGIKFHDAIEDIKVNRIKNGKSREKITTEKITNLIVRHEHWKDIVKDIENIKEEEILKYG